MHERKRRKDDGIASGFIQLRMGSGRKGKWEENIFTLFSLFSFFLLFVPKLAWNLIHPPLILHRLQHATPLSRISQHRRRLEKFISCDEWRRLCSTKAAYHMENWKLIFLFSLASFFFFFISSRSLERVCTCRTLWMECWDVPTMSSHRVHWRKIDFLTKVNMTWLILRSRQSPLETSEKFTCMTTTTTYVTMSACVSGSDEEKQLMERDGNLP